MPRFIRSNLKYKIGSYGHMYSRIQEVKKERDVDILFLGSSHAYRGFDTRIYRELGFKTFNLGSSAQTPLQTQVLLKRYLKNLNPKVVVYEVYPNSFNNDGFESSLDLIANDENDLLSFKMVLEVNSLPTYITFIYGYTLDLFGIKKPFNESVIKVNDKYVTGGFVEKNIAFYTPINLGNHKISLNNMQLDYFSEIVQLLNSKDIELILVYAPIPKVNYERYINNDYFDNVMNGYSKYYNMNEILTLNDSLHFYDSHHLNQNGVIIFNKKLIEVLDL